MEPSWPKFQPYCRNTRRVDAPPRKRQDQANPIHTARAVTMGSVARYTDLSAIVKVKCGELTKRPD